MQVLGAGHPYQSSLKGSRSLSGSTLPAAVGTLHEKPSPDKSQEHRAAGKGFSPGPEVVMDGSR